MHIELPVKNRWYKNQEMHIRLNREFKVNMHKKTGDVKVAEMCMRCKEYVDNSLPMCSKCRIDMKDFAELVDFLNKFDGDKKDALWLIGSEIADRQSMIIGSCKVVHDLESGIMRLEAPSGKPLAQRKIEEIEKLYRAKSILKSYYGI
jgi:hypothetical protein